MNQLALKQDTDTNKAVEDIFDMSKDDKKQELVRIREELLPHSASEMAYAEVRLESEREEGIEIGMDRGIERERTKMILKLRAMGMREAANAVFYAKVCCE